MTCKNCLHYEACKGTYYTAKGCDNIALYDFDGEMYADSGCEDFTERSEWVHLPCKIGSRIFVIPTKENRLEEITEMKALGFSIGKPCNNANCFRVRGSAALFQPSFNDFGISIFLTREEAEKHLEEFKDV